VGEQAQAIERRFGAEGGGVRADRAVVEPALQLVGEDLG
jgi:hypothetical protein